MFTTVQPLILASGSPRRKELLAQLGLDFGVVVPEVDEAQLPTEGEEQYALRLARLKSEAVGHQHPSCWVVAAVTIVVVGDKLLTKPLTADQAVEMLLELAGREHLVRTGFCLYRRDRDVSVVDSVASQVRFKTFGSDWAEAYVRTGEPMSSDCRWPRWSIC